jgi:Integrase core domain
VRFFVRDRDAKLTRAFDDVFGSDHADVLITPVPAPHANAYASAERWIRTVRAECLDWLLIVGRSHLEQVLRVCVKHYNAHRPHRALGLEAPCPAAGLHLIHEGGQAGYSDVTCSAGSSTSTGKLHEWRELAIAML